MALSVLMKSGTGWYVSRGTGPKDEVYTRDLSGAKKFPYWERGGGEDAGHYVYAENERCANEVVVLLG